MRLPQAFVRNKDSGKEVERLLKEPKKEENLFALEDLLESCEEYLAEGKYLSFYDSYKLGEELANKSNYNKKELEELNREIIIKEIENLGVYFSALVNKIISVNDTLTLKFDRKFECLGVYLKKGTLITEGSTGNWTGYNMKGGKIYIQKNAGKKTGYQMSGGEIHVEGEIEHISSSCKGKIYHRGELVWPKKTTSGGAGFEKP